MTRGALPLLLAVCCGCMAMEPRHADTAQLYARASFDLGCPTELVRVYSFGERARGVMGCSRRLSYVEDCDASGACTWRLDTPSFEQQLWPDAAAYYARQRRPRTAQPQPPPPPAPAPSPTPDTSTDVKDVTYPWKNPPVSRDRGF